MPRQKRKAVPVEETDEAALLPTHVTLTPEPDAAHIWGNPDVRRHVLNRFLHAMAMGSTRAVAAQYAGVSLAGVVGWLELGEKEAKRRQNGLPPDYSETTEEYYKLWQAYNQRLGECAVNALTVVNSAVAGGSLNAATWVLEKRFGYGAATRVNHKVAGRLEHDHTHKIEPLSDERLRELLPHATQDMDDT